MKRLAAITLPLLALYAAQAWAKPPVVKDKEIHVKHKTGNLAPIKAKEGIVSAHGPYESGDCGLCHTGKDPANPGPAQTPVNAVCYNCHEDIQQLIAKGKYKHKTAEQSCTNCHNPHNSKQKKLMAGAMPGICVECHTGIKNAMASAHKHEAMTSESSCSNCHSPHASNVEHLLSRLPFDQCVGCHNKDGMKDEAGKPLTNYKKLLDENQVHHAPVAGKDCSSCHKPHGGDNFRLLSMAYPPAFYAPYDAANYALCFSCHDEKLVSAAETTTLTRFRDGKTNLHYLHVAKSDRGRTCRACHEVHASKQRFQIRDDVPFGSSGWRLKINFKMNADGGTCDKTCHTAKSYVNTTRK